MCGCTNKRSCLAGFADGLLVVTSPRLRYDASAAAAVKSGNNDDDDHYDNSVNTTAQAQVALLFSECASTRGCLRLVLLLFFCYD